ncbi:MAG TPA: DUF2079 domain-containing protein, partial [Actinomycetota bacterium]|nr:DUF2079 domain-containing protein [Actinomycetota bacterium]
MRGIVAIAPAVTVVVFGASSLAVAFEQTLGLRLHWILLLASIAAWLGSATQAAGRDGGGLEALRRQGLCFTPLLITVVLWAMPPEQQPAHVALSLIPLAVLLTWALLRMQGALVAPAWRTAAFFLPPVLLGAAGAWVVRDLRASVTAPAVILLALGSTASLMAWRLSSPRRDRPGGQRSERPWNATIFVVSAAAAALFFVISLAKHNNVNSSLGDLGIYEEVIYNISNGSWGDFLRYLTSHMHFELILFPVALIYRLLGQQTWVLLAVQALALAGGTRPLYLVARHITGNLPFSLPFSLVLAVAYLCFPALQWVAYFDFHSIAFAPLFLLTSFYGLLTRRWWLFGVSTLLALACKEEVSLTVAALGLYAALSGRGRLVGLGTVVVGLGWFMAVTQVLTPLVAPNGYTVISREFASLGGSPAEIARSFLTDPARVASVVIQPRKVDYLLYLTVPVGLLCLSPGVAFLPAVPGLATVFLSTVERVTLPGFHYGASVISWIAVMTAFTVARGSLLLRADLRRRWMAAATALIATCALGTTFLIGYVPWARGFSLHMLTWGDRGPTVDRIAELIPAGETVWTSNHVAPHVIRGRFLTEFALDHPDTKPVPAAQVTQRYVLLDLTERKHPSGPSAGDLLLPLLGEDSPFGVRAFENDFVLLQRGYSKEANPSVADYIARHRLYRPGDLPALTGRNGKASRHVDKPGYLATGPYVTVPPGLYRAVFGLRLGQETEAQVGSIDVSWADQTLAGRPIHGAEFRAVNATQDFTLEFVSVTDAPLEFRIAFSGAADLAYDYIRLEPADEVRVPFDRISAALLDSPAVHGAATDAESETVTFKLGPSTDGNASIRARLLKRREFTPGQLVSQSGAGRRVSEAVGDVLRADPRLDRPGYLVTGPWLALEAGTYEAVYWLRVGETSSKDAIMMLDVSGLTGSSSLQILQQPVRAVDLAP